MQSPKYQDIRVLAFPTPEEKVEQIEVKQVKKQPVILISLSLGLILGITLGATAVWINPEQTNLRDLKDSVTNAELKINQVKQCINGI